MTGRIVFAAALGCLAPMGATAQETDLEVLHVSGNVYSLQTPTAVGNVAVLVGPEGALLIDDQFAPLSQAIVDAVAGIDGSEIRFVVNTHVHPDHIGSNEALAEQGALIFAHENVRLRMLEPIRIPRRGGVMFPQPPESALPVVTYSDGIRFHLNGEDVRVFLAPPAHTDGDSFIHFTDSDVLHLGDVFRTNMYPIIDHHNGGSFEGMIDAMEIAIGIAGPDTKVVPGHGAGITDRDGMVEVLVMMLDVRERVRARIAAGDSLEDVLAAGLTDHLDARWGQVESWNASDLLPIVFAELTDGL